jgi:hypothetical protein
VKDSTRAGDQPHASVLELSALHGVQVDRVAEEQHEVLGPAAPEQGVHHHRQLVAEDPDGGPAGLVPVTVGTVQDGLPPALREAGDVGQHLGQAGGDEDPAGFDLFAVGQFHAESGCGPGDAADRAGAELDTVSLGVGAPGRQQIAGADGFPGQVVVDLGRGGVARLLPVDDEYRPQGTAQYHSVGRSSGTAADDYHVMRHIPTVSPPRGSEKGVLHRSVTVGMVSR